MHSLSELTQNGDDVFTSIHAKLVALWLFACVAMILMFVMALRETHEDYHLELRQEISQPLARVLVEESPGMSAVPNEAGRWQQTLARYAKINPEIGAYLVDQNGEVVAASIPLAELKRRQVEILPIEQYANGAQTTLTGLDPLDPARPKAFSSVAVPGGYLYVLLRDPDRLGSAQQLQKRDAYVQAMWLVVCWAAMAAFAGIVTVRMITRPLKQLNKVVDQFRNENFAGDSTAILKALPSTKDEFGTLSRAIQEMSSRIVSQMKELEENDAARRELFANISHDLRTPLTSLLGYLETVTDAKNITDDDRHKYCQIAMQEAHHLSGLVDGLLELAKLDTPGMSASPAPFPCSDLITSVTARFSHSAAEKGISLICPTSSPTQWVIADFALIRRVMGNLLENAVRHTQPGGKIGIELVVSGNDAAMAMTTTVWDTGSGISPENLARIFDRFYRGEKSRQSTSNGAGLGLAICKRILELHNSTISVDSAPGQGARFSFTLPIANAHDLQTARVEDAGSASFRGGPVSSPTASEFA